MSGRDLGALYLRVNHGLGMGLDSNYNSWLEGFAATKKVLVELLVVHFKVSNSRNFCKFYMVRDHRKMARIREISGA